MLVMSIAGKNNPSYRWISCNVVDEQYVQGQLKAIKQKANRELEISH